MKFRSEMASEADARLANQIREAGWERFLLERKAPEQWAFWFGENGLASSVSQNPGEKDFALNLSALGQRVRRHLKETAEV